jgi:exosome complex component RRP42
MSSTPHLPPIATIAQKTVVDMLATGRRVDDRGLNDFREIKLEVGLIERACGSALINLGKTKVMVGVKVEEGEPFPDTPDEGVLTVNAELVPLASPSFEPGPPNENAIELARVVDRGIRESKAIDLKRLCIQPKKKVFVVFVDVYVLDHDGNLIDASSIASLAALASAKMNDYEVEDGEVVYKSGLRSLPIQNHPVSVTLAKIGRSLVVDPSLDEEQVTTARLTVISDNDGRICAMQKGGAGVLSIEEVKQGVAVALSKAPEIRLKVMEAIRT